MEDKYYNPKITEFYTGFEYEYYSEGLSDLDVDGISGWYNTIFDLDIEDGEQRHPSKKVRVKYLSKEDIESLGFKHKQNNQFESNEDNYLSLEYFDENKGWYLVYSENESQFGFGGWIKNKSELKVLLKQLNVINE